MMAPTSVSLFAISDAMKIIRADTIIFVALNIFFLKYYTPQCKEKK